jgi:uncharacterized RDD family membrane protein YckC
VDPEEYADAVEHLEEAYLAGGMSADEYTRRRHELEERTPTAQSDPQPAGWEPMPPIPAPPSATPGHGDPVTGAPLASWGRRAGGWFVDLLVYIVAFLATFAFALMTEDSATGEISDLAALLIFFVWFLGPSLYTWLMVGAWGRTLGKMAVGVTVVRGADAGRVSYLRSLGRTASTWLLGILFFPILLAYLWPLWDRRNQALYDKMAGTIVVRRGRPPAASTD